MQQVAIESEKHSSEVGSPLKQCGVLESYRSIFLSGENVNALFSQALRDG